MGGSSSSQNRVYSVPIQGTKERGFSHIYRNPKNLQKLVSTPDNNFSSIKDVIYSSFKKFEKQDFLGRIKITSSQQNGENVDQRQLTKFTYGQVFNMAERLGSFLLNNRFQYQENLHGMKLVGIFSKNRYEWLVADIACMLHGLTIVPLYDTLGIQNLTYCLQHSGVTTIFVTNDTIKTILKLKGHGNLKNLICFDPITQQIKNSLNGTKFNIIPFEEALKQNPTVNHRQIVVTGQNCLTFSYTSGTTGPPKGALLSHGNFLAFLGSFLQHQIGGFRSDDSYVSFLPLPHVFERVVQAAMMLAGSFVTFYNGDILKFKDDLAFVKPTIFIAVPRLFNRIMQGVQKQFKQATGVKGCLIGSGMKSKMEQLRDDGTYKSSLYDSVVFSKVREKFGGRVRLMITGSAPIKKDTYEFMKVIMCCPFYEGYGQTENTAAAFITNAVDSVSGHVGGVVVNFNVIQGSLQFKLNDIQEMQYTSQDKDDKGRPTPRGEVWLRGPSVFMGYYKDQEKTRETITPDGWLKTGDVGMLLPGSNALKVIDRRKNIFKLQQGEYVAAEKVQAIYSKSPLVAQSFIHGQSDQNFALAIVVPNKEELLKLAAKHQISGSYEEICRNKALREIVVKELDVVGKQAGLMSFEQAKNIVFEPENFQARGILSSTMKLQRFAAKKYYEKQIQSMYSEGQLLTR